MTAYSKVLQRVRDFKRNLKSTRTTLRRFNTRTGNLLILIAETEKEIPILERRLASIKEKLPGLKTHLEQTEKSTKTHREKKIQQEKQLKLAIRAAKVAKLIHELEQELE